MWFLVLTLGFIFAIGFNIHLILQITLHRQKIKEWTNQLYTQYPGCIIIVITDQYAAIYIIEDRIWVNSKDIKEYMATRSFMKVNWQKEGF